MAFNATIQWTTAGVNARQAFMGLRVAIPDQGWFRDALSDAIHAWALMTMTAYNPGPNPDGTGLISYRSATSPNPKQLTTRWACNALNWSPAGVTLQITNVS